MKFNKMRIAALAMAAVMTATSIAPSVMAEELLSAGDEVVEVVEAVEEVPALGTEDELTSEVNELPAVEAGEDFGWVENVSFWKFILNVDPYKEFEFEGKTYKYEDYKRPVCLYFLYDTNKKEFAAEPKVVDAVKEEGTEVKTATCLTDAYYYMIATTTISGKEIKDARTDKIITAAGGEDKHHYVEIPDNRYVETRPTCTTDGTGHALEKCTICGKVRDVDISGQLKAYGHDWGEAAPSIMTEGFVVPESTIEKGSLEEGVFPVVMYVWDPEKLDFTEKPYDGRPITNTKVVNDQVVLIDNQKDGYYAELNTKTCKRDANHKQFEYVVREILAEKLYIKKVMAQENIVTPLTTAEAYAAGTIPHNYYDPTDSLYVNWEKIELENCTKDGRYLVVTFEADDPNKPINQEWVPVPYHHLLSRVQIEFDKYGKDGNDWKNQCIVVYAPEGKTFEGGKTYKIINTHCSMPVPYYEVVHCTAAGCPLKEKQAEYVLPNLPKKEDGYTVKPGTEYLYNAHISAHEYSREKLPAEAEGDHLWYIDNELKNELDALDKQDMSKKAGFYDYLLTKQKENEPYFKVGKNTATCTEDGTVTVQYFCKLCGKWHLDVVYTTPKLGHIPLIPTMDKNSIVAPTCQVEGSYDAITVCDRCKEVLERRKVIIPKAPHTNEIPDGSNIPYRYIDDIYNTNNLTPVVELSGEVVVGINGFNGKDYLTGARKEIRKGQTFQGDWRNPYVGIKAGDDVNASQDYCVTTHAYTVCSTCNPDIAEPHKVELEDSDLLKITVDSLKDQAYTCNPGTITLTASYPKGDVKVTGEYPYFKSINDYQGRSLHQWGDAVQETIDGVDYMVVRCDVCGMIKSKTEVVVPTETPTPTPTPVVKIDTVVETENVKVVLGDTVSASVSTNSDSEIITFVSADESIATVDENGVITGKGYGDTTITVIVTGNEKYTDGVDEFTVSVRPAKTVVLMLRDEGAGTMYVKWRITHGVDGYQYAWATDPEFSDIRYSAAYGESKNTQRRYGLDNAAYYVKIRTFVLDDEGNRIYSDWSSFKTIDINRYLEVPVATCTDLGGNKFAFEVTKPSYGAVGYQISIDGKTASYVRTKFTRKASTAGDDIKIRAYAIAEDGKKYFSEWVTFE